MTDALFKANTVTERRRRERETSIYCRGVLDGIAYTCTVIAGAGALWLWLFPWR